MFETSKSLLERVRASSEQEPWELLASIYTPLLRRWTKQYDLQLCDADDLIQEVLAVVARDVSGFEHNGRQGAFRNWLKTILIHRVRNFWRNRKYRPTVGNGTDFQLHLQELEDPNSDLSATWNREHDRIVLARLWALVEPRFNERTRIAFRRQVVDGASAAEVSAELGVSVNAVLIAKSRVLKELRSEGRGLLDEMA